MEKKMRKNQSMNNEGFQGTRPDLTSRETSKTPPGIMDTGTSSAVDLGPPSTYEDIMHNYGDFLFGTQLETMSAQGEQNNSVMQNHYMQNQQLASATQHQNFMNQPAFPSHLSATPTVEQHNTGSGILEASSSFQNLHPATH